MRCFFIGFVGFLVAGVIAALAIPAYADYRSRAALIDTLQAVLPFREAVGEALMKQSRALPQATDAIAGVNYLKLMADGTIVFRNAKYGQVIVLEPELRGTAVTWRCIGGPAKDVPVQCR